MHYLCFLLVLPLELTIINKSDHHSSLMEVEKVVFNWVYFRSDIINEKCLLSYICFLYFSFKPCNFVLLILSTSKTFVHQCSINEDGNALMYIFTKCLFLAWTSIYINAKFFLYCVFLDYVSPWIKYVIYNETMCRNNQLVNKR